MRSSVLKPYVAIVATAAVVSFVGCQEGAAMSKRSPSANPEVTKAAQNAISGVLLKCDSAGLPDDRTFCLLLARALKAKGLTVVPYAGQPAQRLGAELVILETVGLQRTALGLSLRLKWTYGATGQIGQSKVAGLRALDADLTVDMYDHFVFGLVKPQVLPFLR